MASGTSGSRWISRSNSEEWCGANSGRRQTIGNVSRKGSTILVNHPVSLAHQSSSLLGKPSSTSASTMNHAFQESDSVNDSTVPGTFLERPRQMRRKTTNRNKVDSSRSIIEMLEDGDKKDQQLVALRIFLSLARQKRSNWHGTHCFRLPFHQTIIMTPITEIITAAAMMPLLSMIGLTMRPLTLIPWLVMAMH
jgi:hypothetical protein